MADIPYLTIHWPDGKTENFQLGAEVIRIGRSADKNDLTAPSEFSTISSSHAELQRIADGYQIVDLKSSNGTFVNAQRIEGIELVDGDEIRIGSEASNQLVRLIYHSGGQPTGMRPISEMPVFEKTPKFSGAHLSTHWPSGEEIFFQLDKDTVVLGRSGNADMIFPQSLGFVSNRHLEIRRTPEGYEVMDLGSTNGTKLNNEVVTAPMRLHDGDIIRMGDERFGSSIGVRFHRPREEALAPAGYSESGKVILESVPAEGIVIGRSTSSQIVLNSPSVSRRHAVVFPHNGGHAIRDLGSSNGTYVNGQRITETVLKLDDTVQIGGFALTYDGQTLIRFDSQGMRLDVVDVYKEVGTPKGKIRILDDIDMTIVPREFVAMVGGSGAGKSTLMDALNGFRPAKGHVLLNGVDFYPNYDRFRTELGYVPQSDILHTSLTVEKALDYAARLRLPSDVGGAERKQRIAKVLETVGMDTEKVRKTRISNLSGGQRKRVSIAAELLAEPKLFFLDEPTSGLDPGLEKKMMYTLRSMADEGRTIVLITHATNNIVQVDQVCFLSQGKVVYFGPPQEALEFFEVDEFADIYEKIETHGDEWYDAFHNKKPAHFARYVTGRRQSQPETPAVGGTKRGFSLGESLRQFWLFSQRMVDIIFSERLTTAVLLAIMPLIGAFLLILAKPYYLVGDPEVTADPAAAAGDRTENYLPTKDATTTLFVMSLAAVLLGLFGASNELVGERTIYLRERMVNLKLPPYLFSKIVVFSVFAAVQCALLLLVLSTRVTFPPGLLLPSWIEFYITLLLATLASLALGLFLSSIARTANMVLYLILIVLFVQIVFSGAIFETRNKPVIEQISQATITHWALKGLGTSTDVNQLASYNISCAPSTKDNPLTDEDERGMEFCWLRPISPDKLPFAYGDDFNQLLLSWGVLLGYALVFTVLTFVAVKGLDRR